MKNLLFIYLIFLSCNTDSQPKQTDDIRDSMPLSNSNSESNTIIFKKYCNSRFEYCIDYPSEVLFQQPESYNGDGCVFKNKKAEEILRVYGSIANGSEGEDLSIEQQYEDDIHGLYEEDGNSSRVLTYQKLSKSFYVISGYNKGKIFYQKTILKGDSFATALLTYDESDKLFYDKIAEKIFSSFR